MKRRVIVAGLAVLAAVTFAGWAWLSRAAPEAAPATTAVRRGTVVQTVLATGMLEARQLVSVGARVSGQVESLAVALGQVVEAGDPIAQIDSQDQQNTLLQAQAALTNIEAQIAGRQATLERAEASLARQKELGVQNYASREAVEIATTEVLVYRAELASLAAQKASAGVTVSTAQVALERTRITAPIDGTVVAVLVKQGQSVNAAQSAPTIVKIADLSTMLVKVEISEADVMRVTPGQRVSFTTLGAPGQPFAAVVREIEPAPTAIETSDAIASDSAIYYNGLLEVQNPGGQLRIGMTAEVSIELARAEDVPVVPAGAVHRDGSGDYVEVFDPATRTSARRAVVTGVSDKVTVEIRTGLELGETVVTGAAAAAGPVQQGQRGGRSRFGPPGLF